MFGDFSISSRFSPGSATFNRINCTESLKSRAYCTPSAGTESPLFPRQSLSPGRLLLWPVARLLGVCLQQSPGGHGCTSRGQSSWGRRAAETCRTIFLPQFGQQYPSRWNICLIRTKPRGKTHSCSHQLLLLQRFIAGIKREHILPKARRQLNPDRGKKSSLVRSTMSNLAWLYPCRSPYLQWFALFWMQTGGYVFFPVHQLSWPKLAIRSWLKEILNKEWKQAQKSAAASPSSCIRLTAANVSFIYCLLSTKSFCLAGEVKLGILD